MFAGEFPRFARPDGAAPNLGVAPRPRERGRRGAPVPGRTPGGYQAKASELLANDLASITGSWTLGLDVGLADAVPLLSEHDLDNYAYPLAYNLSQATRAPLVSAWCSKRHAADSFVIRGTGGACFRHGVFGVARPNHRLSPQPPRTSSRSESRRSGRSRFRTVR